MKKNAKEVHKIKDDKSATGKGTTDSSPVGANKRRKAYRQGAGDDQGCDLPGTGRNGVKEDQALRKRVVVRPDLLGTAGGDEASRTDLLHSARLWDFVQVRDRNQFITLGEIPNTEGGKRIFRFLCRLNGLDGYKKLDARLKSIKHSRK